MFPCFDNDETDLPFQHVNQRQPRRHGQTGLVGRGPHLSLQLTMVFASPESFQQSELPPPRSRSLPHRLHQPTESRALPRGTRHFTLFSGLVPPNRRPTGRSLDRTEMVRASRHLALSPVDNTATPQNRRPTATLCPAPAAHRGGKQAEYMHTSAGPLAGAPLAGLFTLELELELESDRDPPCHVGRFLRRSPGTMRRWSNCLGMGSRRAGFSGMSCPPAMPRA